ncbi:Uncharacterised protein [Vibrio cholerae]|nr:Uncharacterised protein [Vibrio cholerae]
MNIHPNTIFHFCEWFYRYNFSLCNMTSSDSTESSNVCTDINISGVMLTMINNPVTHT